MRKLIGLPILALILCSCSFKPLTDKFNEVTAPDYVNSSKAEKLQLPPDLSEYETSDTYNVPGAATSYTDFENQRNRKIEKVELLHDAMFIESNPIPVKWLLSYLGKINSKIRLPLVTLDEKYHQKLITAYEASL